MSTLSSEPAIKISGATVRADFNSLESIKHYTRSVERVGLWASERVMIERCFPKKSMRLLEAGCGTGRATFGLAELGYRRLVAFDFAEDLLDQARDFAKQRGLKGIKFLHADATQLEPTPANCNLLGYKTESSRVNATDQSNRIGYKSNSPRENTTEQSHLLGDNATSDRAGGKEQSHLIGYVAVGAKSSGRSGNALRAERFDGVLFLFNGLMQIPGREHRRAALRGLFTLAKPGAPLLFTTHDRDDEPGERRHWKRQAELWAQGKQDPTLLEFGDRYFVDDDNYRVFMHLPNRAEIL